MIAITALSASLTHEVADVKSADPGAQRLTDGNLVASAIRRIKELTLDGFPVLAVFYGASGLPTTWRQTSFQHVSPCSCDSCKASQSDDILILVAGGAEAREALAHFRRFGLIVNDGHGVPRRVQLDIRGGIVLSDDGADARDNVESVSMTEKACPFPEQVKLF
jgi:hypothetical protein